MKVLSLSDSSLFIFIVMFTLADFVAVAAVAWSMSHWLMKVQCSVPSAYLMGHYMHIKRRNHTSSSICTLTGSTGPENWKMIGFNLSGGYTTEQMVSCSGCSTG